MFRNIFPSQNVQTSQFIITTDCVNCPLPTFFFGKKPDRRYSPPVYVTIHQCPRTLYKREGRSIHRSPDHNFLDNEAQTNTQGEEYPTKPMGTASTATVMLITPTAIKLPSQPPTHPSVSNEITSQSPDPLKPVSASTEEHITTPLLFSQPTPTGTLSISLVSNTSETPMYINGDQLEGRETSQATLPTHANFPSTTDRNPVSTTSSKQEGSHDTEINSETANNHTIIAQLTDTLSSLLMTVSTPTSPVPLANSSSNYSQATEQDSTK